MIKIPMRVWPYRNYAMKLWPYTYGHLHPWFTYGIIKTLEWHLESIISIYMQYMPFMILLLQFYPAGMVTIWGQYILKWCWFWSSECVWYFKALTNFSAIDLPITLILWNVVQIKTILYTIVKILGFLSDDTHKNPNTNQYKSMCWKWQLNISCNIKIIHKFNVKPVQNWSQLSQWCMSNASWVISTSLTSRQYCAHVMQVCESHYFHIWMVLLSVHVWPSSIWTVGNNCMLAVH